MRDATAEQKWLRRLQRAGEVLEALGEGFGCKGLEGGVVWEVRILLAAGDRGDVLCVVKARVEDDRFVAFVGGPDVTTALLSWRKKEQGQGLRFRVEEPYGG